MISRSAPPSVVISLTPPSSLAASASSSASSFPVITLPQTAPAHATRAPELACGNCGKTGGHLKACAACGAVSYCNRDVSVESERREKE